MAFFLSVSILIWKFVALSLINHYQVQAAQLRGMQMRADQQLLLSLRLPVLRSQAGLHLPIIALLPVSTDAGAGAVIQEEASAAAAEANTRPLRLETLETSVVGPYRRTAVRVDMAMSLAELVAFFEYVKVAKVTLFINDLNVVATIEGGEPKLDISLLVYGYHLASANEDAT